VTHDFLNSRHSLQKMNCKYKSCTSACRIPCCPDKGTTKLLISWDWSHSSYTNSGAMLKYWIELCRQASDSRERPHLRCAQPNLLSLSTTTIHLNMYKHYPKSTEPWPALCPAWQNNNLLEYSPDQTNLPLSYILLYIIPAWPWCMNTYACALFKLLQSPRLQDPGTTNLKLTDATTTLWLLTWPVLPL
jgi:hypothetical protein